MKDIRQYIHLYIGCKFQWKDGDGEWRKPQMLTAYQLSNIINNWVEVKLLLRPLDSMTEEEQKELWRLVFSMGHGKEFGDKFKEFTGRVQFINEKSYYQVPRHIMTQGIERLAIESDGTVWADCDLHNWRHNQHEVTRFLLSKHFDLFGLLESNLAVASNK